MRIGGAAGLALGGAAVLALIGSYRPVMAAVPVPSRATEEMRKACWHP
jgi:hypothetical protein